MQYIKQLSENPTLTIGIPTLNEENYIASILNTFSSSSYPHIVEILVCDGGSTDKTREIVNQFAKKDPRVKLVDNPQKKQVYAFNTMIKIAQGELLMIAGAHAHYEADYVNKCINLHKTTEALNVGGPTKLKAKSKTQAGILLAWYSVLGNGGAKHRNPNYTGYTDTLFPGCYVTEALRKVGGFNVENVTNQDTELNLRISKLKDKAHYIDATVDVYYYPRDSFSALAKQYFRYGRGRFLTSVKHFPKIPLRGYISFLFLLFNVGVFYVGSSINPLSLVLYLGILLAALLTNSLFTYKNVLASQMKIGRAHV